jgi:hypothetical protein
LQTLVAQTALGWKNSAKVSNSKFKVYPSAIGIKGRHCAIEGAENALVREGAIIRPIPSMA